MAGAWGPLAAIGPGLTAILSCLLTGSIVLYDAVHKIFALSPVLAAICRFFHLVAASAGHDGVTGLAVGALVLVSRIGLSYLARKEYPRPSALLALFIAGCPDISRPARQRRPLPDARSPASTLLAIWIIRRLRFTFGGADRNIGLTVSGLLAASLVDLLAVADVSPLLVGVFVLLFVSALLAQRFIPAT